MGKQANNPVKSVVTTFRILQTLRRLDGAGVTELSTELDLPKSSVYNYLSTLEQEEYVVKEDGQYTLGLRFLDLGRYVRERDDLYETARPEMESIGEETGELVNLLVEEHGQGVYVCRVRGDQAVNVAASTGHRVSLHNTGLGKAILAYLPEERVDEILDENGLSADTPHTITDRDELKAELDRIRERGVAFDREERIGGLCCVAVPVLDLDDRPIGALSVAGPTSRMKGERFESELPELLKSAANVIELNLTYS
ncbi:IclR family transcriptional regulator [Natrinema salifodinae]|uniref:Transcriptional regulator, IclR family n=1 Tax=Natrinema salifodinae TaxID=1202768 RepID=A0A1I0MBF7_9EURY|nr:IclR family transcriptional regulator [Natrinema salifodinae]SEV85046.1 transcriptional regulator, IclR family [Natrinema salifodinae]